jgi:Fic family protein
MSGIGPLPWWGTLELTADSLLNGIQAAQQTLESTAGKEQLLQEFRRHSAVTCVYLSNSMEGTLPPGVSCHDTYQLVAAELEGQETASTEPVQEWDPEGAADRVGARAQLQAHMRALKYLCQHCLPGPLTSQQVREAHRLLMEGARGLAGGEYRVTPSHSGTGYVYPLPSTIPGQVEHILEAFNSQVSSIATVAAAVQATADLLYDMLVLHPFVDGNGRLCRLLATYALCAFGQPFPIPMHNGHSRARKHYQSMLLHADHHHHKSRLLAYILECVAYKWANLETLCQQQQQQQQQS